MDVNGIQQLFKKRIKDGVNKLKRVNIIHHMTLAYCFLPLVKLNKRCKTIPTPIDKNRLGNM